MRVLRDVTPTQEQRKVILSYEPGFVVVRGAAGSGKTTTAVFRLRAITEVWRRQRKRHGGAPLRVLVLTYNKTLRGYVKQLVSDQLREWDDVSYNLTTFSKWAYHALDGPKLVTNKQREGKIWRLGSSLGLSKGFVLSEVDYVLGRYPRGKYKNYTTSGQPLYQRRGRGATPRMDQALRERLVNEVIKPYEAWKKDEGLLDWNDLAVQMQKRQVEPYDIVIVDEAQDFSANQIRAVIARLADAHSTTFVLDAVQRIYPHNFRWSEVGITKIVRSDRLTVNHRNTRQIAAFALPLLKDLQISDDGTLPDFKSCKRDGPLPIVIQGRYSRQMDFIVRWIEEVPKDESVALLHTHGGGWFDYTRDRLGAAGIEYVEIAGRSEWPQGPENLALSTLASAKGLEFDHVGILGLSSNLMPHGPEDDDTELDQHRRLVAMAIGRARERALLTFKPEEAASVVEYLKPKTYESKVLG